MRRITVTVGPVPAASAAAWLASADVTLRTLQTGPDIDVPWDVLVAFEDYLRQWHAVMHEADDVFLWSAEVDDDVVRRIGLHWGRMVSVVRSGRPRGLATATPEAAPFYDAVVTGIATGLASAGDPALADAFTDAVPEFDATAPVADPDRATRVLIVDDREDVRLLLRIWLERDPSFEVAGEVCDGHRAIEVARLTQPDVALVDIDLPDMSGVQVLPLIQLAAPACALVVSSSADTQVAAAAAGASAFVSRSAAAPEVLAAIRQVAATSASLRP